MLRSLVYQYGQPSQTLMLISSYMQTEDDNWLSFISSVSHLPLDAHHLPGALGSRGAGTNGAGTSTDSSSTSASHSSTNLDHANDNVNLHRRISFPPAYDPAAALAQHVQSRTSSPILGSGAHSLAGPSPYSSAVYPSASPSTSTTPADLPHFDAFFPPPSSTEDSFFPNHRNNQPAGTSVADLPPLPLPGLHHRSSYRHLPQAPTPQPYYSLDPFHLPDHFNFSPQEGPSPMNSATSPSSKGSPHSHPRASTSTSSSSSASAAAAASVAETVPTSAPPRTRPSRANSSSGVRPLATRSKSGSKIAAAPSHAAGLPSRENSPETSASRSRPRATSTSVPTRGTSRARDEEGREDDDGAEDDAEEDKRRRNTEASARFRSVDNLFSFHHLRLTVRLCLT